MLLIVEICSNWVLILQGKYTECICKVIGYTIAREVGLEQVYK